VTEAVTTISTDIQHSANDFCQSSPTVQKIIKCCQDREAVIFRLSALYLGGKLNAWMLHWILTKYSVSLSDDSNHEICHMNVKYWHVQITFCYNHQFLFMTQFLFYIFSYNLCFLHHLCVSQHFALLRMHVWSLLL